MKALLINPPIQRTFHNREFYLPCSLLALGATLQEENHKVELLDFRKFQKDKDPPEDFYGEKLVERISEFQPDFIGIGCLFSGYFPDLLKLSEIAKEKYPEIPNIIGGIHPTLYARDILENCPTLDHIVLGEGEDTIIDFIKALRGKMDFNDIDGFAFRDQGVVKVNPKERFIENLDGLPMPAYNLINIEDYYVDTSTWHNPKNLSIQTSVPLVTSRSCPNKCSFCSMFEVMGKKWRPRSAENVVNEMEYIYNELGQRHFSFMDDNVTLNKSRMMDICNKINERGLDLEFETPNGLSVKTLDEELLDTMVSAGFVRTYFAIESGSEQIRNEIMNKHLSNKKIYEVVELTKKYPQLSVNAFFIVGLPEETKETLEETYNMIEKLKFKKTLVKNIVPYPGTPLYEQVMRDGLLINTAPSDMYKAEGMYLTNCDLVNIQPYNLDIKYLLDFKKRCDKMIKGLKK